MQIAWTDYSTLNLNLQSGAGAQNQCKALYIIIAKCWVITRMLKYFQNEGMVKLSRDTIELTNKPRLEELSDQ